MEIKFIVNGKNFTTLCKTVKSVNTFTAELSDIYGNEATVTVDRITGVIYVNKINNVECHISGKFADCGSTEKGFKRNVVNFLIRFVRSKERDFYLLDEENVLFHLSNVVGEMASEASDTEEIEEKEETHIIANPCDYHIFTTDAKEILSALISLYENNITPDAIEMHGFRFSPIDYIDSLFEKDYYNIIEHKSTYERGFFHIYHGYATKRLLIEANKSNVFNKWTKIAPIPKRAFLEGVKWICGDTSPEEGHYTRAIALTSKGVKKLFAFKTNFGYKYRDITGQIFIGDDFIRKPLSEKEKLFADENGNISMFCKIILSSKDRV